MSYQDIKVLSKYVLSNFEKVLEIFKKLIFQRETFRFLLFFIQAASQQMGEKAEDVNTDFLFRIFISAFSRKTVFLLLRSFKS